MKYMKKTSKNLQIEICYKDPPYATSYTVTQRPRFLRNVLMT